MENIRINNNVNIRERTHQGDSVYSIDISGLNEVINAVAMYGRNVEIELNDALHGDIANLLHKEIKKRMPRSDRKKKHAKDMNSLGKDKENLMIRVRPYPKYRYLVFPELAIGTSFRNAPQYFFKRSLEDNKDIIINRLNDAIKKGIEKSNLKK